MRKISSNLWLMNRIALPSLFQELDQQEKLLDLLGRSAAVGSSMMTICGVDRHGARDRDQMLVGDAEILQPRVGVDVARHACVVSTSRALARIVFQSIVPKRVRGAWPRKMFSATVSSSNSTVSWWIAVMPCPKPRARWRG